MLIVFAEWRGHRRGNAALTELAHTWAKAMGVLFAAGAVSGTLLSFEMGILWPGLMDRFGEIFGFPFVLEGFAFFIEAIFVGIYLFGWDRMSPRAHMLSALPMIVSGMAGAFFVVAANAWMNNPTGFRLDADGRVVDARPWAAMFGPSTLAAGGAHAPRGPTWSSGSPSPRSTRWGCCGAAATGTTGCGLLIPLTVGAVAAPVQIGVGDWIAGTVAENQPAKLAAMEGLYRTTAGAPLSVGGLFSDDRMNYALEIPRGCRCWSTATRTVGPRAGGGSPGRAPAGQRRAPRLRHHGGARQCAAPAGRRLRLRLVAATAHPRDAVVPPRRGGVRRRGGRRPRGGVGDHRGRPPAVVVYGILRTGTR